MHAYVNPKIIANAHGLLTEYLVLNFYKKLQLLAYANNVHVKNKFNETCFISICNVYVNNILTIELTKRSGHTNINFYCYTLCELSKIWLPLHVVVNVSKDKKNII